MKPESLRTCPLPTMILAGTAWLVSPSLAAADEENGRSLRERFEIERTFELRIESQRNSQPRLRSEQRTLGRRTGDRRWTVIEVAF
jgi:hypothetical protein